MDADQLKKQVAHAALEYVVDGAVIGVGTGSTVNHFIDALAGASKRAAAAVSSSEASTARLRDAGIKIIELSDLVSAGTSLPVYVDGADEIDPNMAMIKGGGGALTREKIVADVAERFICIVDASKQVRVLGKFPLPVEVIPMATMQVAFRLREIGARPVVRAGFVTDNGNAIIDAHELQIKDPVALEEQINQWPGVVTVGLFARSAANVCLVGCADGVRTVGA